MVNKHPRKPTQYFHFHHVKERMENFSRDRRGIVKLHVLGGSARATALIHHPGDRRAPIPCFDVGRWQLHQRFVQFLGWPSVHVRACADLVLAYVPRSRWWFWLDFFISFEMDKLSLSALFCGTTFHQFEELFTPVVLWYDWGNICLSNLFNCT